jgi:hypothetical protein
VNEGALANLGTVAPKTKKKLLFQLLLSSRHQNGKNGDAVSENKIHEVWNFGWTRGENYFSLLNKFVSYMQVNTPL